MSLRFQTASRSARFHLTSSLGNFPIRGEKKNNKIICCGLLEASRRQGRTPPSLAHVCRTLSWTSGSPAPTASPNPSRRPAASRLPWWPPPAALGRPWGDPRQRVLLLKSPHALNRDTRYRQRHLPNPPSRKTPSQAAKISNCLTPRQIGGQRMPRSKLPRAGCGWLGHRRHPPRSPTSSPRLRVTSQSKRHPLGPALT